MAQIRLDKLLCEGSGLSRSEAREAIKRGRVRVNGEISLQPELKLEPRENNVLFDGKKLSGGLIYLMLNKPKGCVSATEDASQVTVLDLLPKELSAGGLFPVGRLDKDTTGLLLLTNDGDFCHAVTAPRKHVSKIYEARVDGILDDGDAKAFLEGVQLRDGTLCLPAKLTIFEGQNDRCLVEIQEGKYHQVKRMLASRGKPVMELKRISIGGLSLDQGLKEGQYREIDQKEIDSIFETVISKSNNM